MRNLFLCVPSPSLTAPKINSKRINRGFIYILFNPEETSAKPFYDVYAVTVVTCVSALVRQLYWPVSMNFDPTKVPVIPHARGALQGTTRSLELALDAYVLL